MAAMVLTRKPSMMPSLSSASSASVTLSRACASDRKASVRVEIHFTGRPVSFEASSTSGISLKIGDFMPNEPPVSSVTMRILLSRMLHQLGEVDAGRVRPLDGGVERVALVGGVVVADRAARLHGRGGDAVDDELLLDDVVGLGEGGVGRRLVADQFDEADVVGRVVPHLDGARLGRVFGRGDRRQRLEVDGDQFGGVERLRHRLGDDEGDVIADPAHAVLGEDRIARLDHRRAVAALQAARDRQIAPAGRLDVGGGQHRQHAGRLFRGAHVERLDLRVRVLRAQHDAVRHAGQLDVVDIAAAALQQPRILEPRHALSDGEFTHWPCLLELSFSFTGPVRGRNCPKSEASPLSVRRRESGDPVRPCRSERSNWSPACAEMSGGCGDANQNHVSP